MPTIPEVAVGVSIGCSRFLNETLRVGAHLLSSTMHLCSKGVKPLTQACSGERQTLHSMYMCEGVLSASTVKHVASVPHNFGISLKLKLSFITRKRAS